MERDEWRALAFDYVAAGFVVLDKPRYGKNKGHLVMTEPTTREVFVMPILDEIISELKGK